MRCYALPRRFSQTRPALARTTFWRLEDGKALDKCLRNDEYDRSFALRGWVWLLHELGASVLHHASGARLEQAPAAQNRQCVPNYYRKGPKSGSSGCLQRRGIAAAAASKATRCTTEQQPRIYRARASGDDHLTRPETLSGNAMWKKLTTTPWRTEDARSGLVSPRRSVCCASCATPRR